MNRAWASEGGFWAGIFPPVAERAAEKHPELMERLPEYRTELRKFLDLLKTAKRPIAMISPRIDHLWHELITCTITYREFCDRFAGRYLDHMPRTEWARIPEEAIWTFFNEYDQRHGNLPSCWFDGLSGEVATMLRQRRISPAFRWSGYVPVGYALD